ncbi:MAG: cyclase family protein [Pseudomonadota bacterium]
MDTLSNLKLIDLTHTIAPNIPCWNGPKSCGFQHEIKLDYTDGNRDPGFRVQQITMHAGIGTHMDAPAHCVPGGDSIAELPLENFFAPCCVIDVSDRIHERYSLSVDDIRGFESQHGKLKENTFVIVYTGWEKFWGTPERYHNNYTFPSVSEKAALILLERKIVGLGIDTFSPDRPEDGFPVHQHILGARKYIIENIANTRLLPPTGAYTLALPIKTFEGTEAPTRLVGLVQC